MAEGKMGTVTFGQRRLKASWRHYFLAPPYTSRWHQLRRCKGFGPVKRLIQRYMKVPSRRCRMFKWTEHKMTTRELAFKYTTEEVLCNLTSSLSTSSASGPR